MKYSLKELLIIEKGNVNPVSRIVDCFKGEFSPSKLGTGQGLNAIASFSSMAAFAMRINNKDFVIGDTLTMADLPMGTSIYRYFNLEIERPSFPNIEAWYSRLCQRSAYQTHAMIPFGSSLEEWNSLEQSGA